MLERYETDFELSDLVTGGKFAMDIPLVEIRGEEFDAETGTDVPDLDTSVIGVPNDRTSGEYEVSDIAISSLIEAANIARTAASLGVVISPNQALRAGQIRTGEVVVDPVYRDNGRRPKVQPPLEESVVAVTETADIAKEVEEISPEPIASHEVVEVSEVEDVDQLLAETESAVEIAENEPPVTEAETLAPPELTAPNEHNEHAGEDETVHEPTTEDIELAERDVDIPAELSSGDAGDKPPIDTSSNETGFSGEDPGKDEGGGEPSSPHRHFAHGQLRSTIRDIARALTDAGIDVGAILTPRQKEALPLLLSDMPNEEIADQLGQKPPSISKMSHLIVEKLINQAPEGMDLRHLAEPVGHVVPDTPNTSVGGTLNAIRAQKGITIDSLVEQLDGRSRRAIHKFFAGEAHPSNTQIILPLLKILDVPPEEANVYLSAYRAERAQRINKPKNTEA